MPDFQVCLFGAPVIEVAGEAVSVDTRKALALLAYLALSGQRHHRDALAAIFWPESDSSSARAALRRTLSALNTAIRGEGLEAGRDSIRFEPTSAITIDVLDFRERFAAVDQHQHTDLRLCTVCQTALIEAVQIYHDDFMAGFTLRDSPDFDIWQYTQAEALRRQLTSSLERLVQGYAAQEDYETAIEYTLRWLTVDPLHEAAHQVLMQLFAWSGDRARSLGQYRECVRILDQELGVSPLEETTRLYEAIQEDRLTSPPATSPEILVERPIPGSSLQIGIAQLPFVGRSDEWTQVMIAHRTAQQSGHLVVVEGEAGIGKTRLADAYTAYAREEGLLVLESRCHQGEVGLAYGPFSDVLRDALASDTSWLEDVDPHWLAEAARLVPELNTLRLGLPPAPTLDTHGVQSRFFESIIQTLFASSTRGVLLLEDLHWVDAASLDLLAYLINRLDRWPWCVFLTWRTENIPRDHRLRAMAGERQRAGEAAILTLGRLSRDAIASLVASANLPDGLDPADAADRLNQETEGLPYFITEYLSFVAAMDAPDLDRAWALPMGVRDLLHSRLAPVSETGWQVLTTAALMGRSFDFDTLRLASGRSEEEIVGALEELLELRLISEENSPISGLHYDFTHDKLREMVQSETSLARRRLVHRRLAEAFAGRNPHSDAVSRIAYHYQEAGEAELAASYYEQAGRYAQSVVASGQAIAHYRNAIGLGHPDASRLHQIIGDLHTLLGEYNAALQSYETAAALGCPADLPLLEHKLGRVYHRLGEWGVAEGHYCAALDALDPSHSASLRTLILADRSLVAHRQGDADRAQKLAEESLAAARSSADTDGLAQAHNSLGILARTAGRLTTARDHLERSLSAAEALDDRGMRAATLNNLALTIADGGDYSQAIDLAQAALKFCQQIDDRHREAAVLNNLADFYHVAGNEPSSRRCLEQAVIIFAEIGDEADGHPEIWKLAEW